MVGTEVRLILFCGQQNIHHVGLIPWSRIIRQKSAAVHLQKIRHVFRNLKGVFKNLQAREHIPQLHILLLDMILIFRFARPLRLRCSFLLASQQPLAHHTLIFSPMHVNSEPHLCYLSLVYCCNNIAENVNYEARCYAVFSVVFSSNYFPQYLLFTELLLLLP